MVVLVTARKEVRVELVLGNLEKLGGGGGGGG